MESCKSPVYVVVEKIKREMRESCKKSKEGEVPILLHSDKESRGHVYSVTTIMVVVSFHSLVIVQVPLTVFLIIITVCLVLSLILLNNRRNDRRNIQDRNNTNFNDQQPL